MKARPGIALLLTLFALIIVEAITTGVCVMVLQAQRGAMARSRTVRAAASSQVELAQLMARWADYRFDTLRVGGTMSVGNVEVERLAQPSFLVTAEVDGHRSVAVARFLDQQRVIDEATMGIPPDTAEALGGVRWDEAASIADASDSVAGYPLIYKEGDAQLVGRNRRGILVVTGNLLIIGGVFEGIVLAKGSIGLQGGARIVGSARSRDFGGYNIPGIEHSDSIIRAAALETPSASRLILQHRRYIPAF